MWRIFFLASFLAVAPCANSQSPLKAVDYVDIHRYSGLWYEIASYPNRFQKDCTATTAEYTLKTNNRIRVLNTCRLETPSGRIKTAEASAWIDDPSTNAKLKVRFFWPFSADYWIIDLDTVDYQYAVVGQPSRKYLWILARSPTMDQTLYASIVERLGRVHGYDPGRLALTVHESKP